MDDVWLRHLVAIFIFVSVLQSVGGEKSSTEISFPFSLYETFVTEGKEIRKNFFAVKAKTMATSVRYGMTSLIDSRSQNFFDIDKETGELSTVSEIDREFMSVHYFKVIATLEGSDKGSQQTATTTVQVGQSIFPNCSLTVWWMFIAKCFLPTAYLQLHFDKPYLSKFWQYWITGNFSAEWL